MAKLQQLEISINGVINPSLIRMINDAEAKLKGLGASVRTSNMAMNAIYKQAFSGAAKATTQANALASSMGRIGEIGAGIGISELFIKGLESGVGLVEKMVDGMKSLSETASAAAAKFELLSKGMGALLRDQGFADLLLTQLQKIEYKSPFEHLALGGVARGLTGRGMDKDRLLGSTTEIGDITAGLGGSQDILDRIALAYGEAFDQETVSKRIMRQFTQAGVPMLNALMNAIGMNPKNAAEVQKFFKMVTANKVPFSVLDKAVYQLTHDGGLFEDGMLHFADTFRGLITTFNAMFLRAEQDFGGIINDWLEVILRFVNNSGVWDDIHDWFVKISDMSRSVITFATGLHESFPVLDQVSVMFDKLNAFIGSFFTEVDIQNSGTSGAMAPGGWPGVGGGSRHMVMNATGNEVIKKIFDDATKIFNEISNFITSPAVQRLSNWTGSVLVDQFKAFFNDLEMLINIIDDLSRGDWSKARTDFNNWKKFAMPGDYKNWAPPDISPQGHPNDQEYLQKLQDNTDALQSLTDGWTGSSGVGSFGGNYGVHGGMSGGQGYSATNWGNVSAYDDAFREASAKSGIPFNTLKAIALQEGVDPRDNNPLGISSGANGINADHFSKEEAKARIVHQAMLPYMRGFRSDATPEERARAFRIYTPPGAANGRGQNQYKQSETEKILKKLNDSPPVTINYHIQTLSQDGVAAVLDAHGDTIKEHLSRLMGLDYERTAPI